MNSNQPSPFQLQRARAKARQLQFGLNLPAPPSVLWPRYFCLTDWHKKLGLFQEHYQVVGHPLGLVKVHSNFSGKAESWWEFPLVWQAPRYFWLERLQSSNSLNYLAWRLELQPQEAGTHLTLTFHFNPLSIPEKHCQHYLEALQRAFLEAVDPVEDGFSPDTAEFLPLVQVAGLPAVDDALLCRESALRLQALLIHTRQRAACWQVLEPDGSLAAFLPVEAPLPFHFQSPKYGHVYTLNPEQHLRLSLSTQTDLRPEYSPFPETQPYRIAQFWLGPGQEYSFSPAQTGALRIASATLSGHLHLRVAVRGETRVQIVLDAQLEDQELPILAQHGQCLLKYPEHGPGAVFYVYQPYETPGGLTAAQVLSCTELLACFPHLQPPEEGWKLSQQVFLAVALCEAQSEALADFQALLAQVAQTWSGRLLEQGQETRLLCFPWAGSALSAALELLRQTEEFNIRQYFPFTLRLQMALHRGAALLTGSQFSGPGVRTTLQLLGQASPQSVLFSRTLIMDPAFQRQLAAEPHLKIYELHRKVRSTGQEPDRIYGIWLSQAPSQRCTEA